MRTLKLFLVALTLFGGASSALARECNCQRRIPRSVLAVPAESGAVTNAVEGAQPNVPFVWGYFGAKVRPQKLYHTGYYGHWYECSTWRIR